MTTQTPTLDDAAIAARLRHAGLQAGLTLSDHAVEVVTRVARGLPDLAQRVGLRITQATVQRGDDLVMDQDIRVAIDVLVAEAAPDVTSAYQEATAGGVDEAARLALERVANAPQDVWGGMRMVHAPDGLTVGGQAVPVPLFVRFKEAGILAPAPHGGGDMVHFRDRGFMAYVQLLALRGSLPA